MNHLFFWIRYAQRENFKIEIEELLPEDDLYKNSKIRVLQPFMDDKGILRTKGRVELMNIDQNWRHPIILPSRHQFTNLLVLSKHLSIGCGGVNYPHRVLQEKYWIVNSKSTIKRILKTCIRCKVMYPTTKEQPISPLPPDRVNVTECFTHIAMDLSGVLYTKDKIQTESEVVTQHNKRYYFY